MIRTLRRNPLLTLFLLLATPALGGAWLQAAHPCPAEAPWVGEHGEEHGSHGAGQSAGGCHCVGSCAGAAGVVVPPRALLPASAAAVSPARPRISPVTLPRVLRPADRLPPATAPPLV